jgi:hypothetical protein
MGLFYIIFTCEYTHGVSAVPPDSPCIIFFSVVRCGDKERDRGLHLVEMFFLRHFMHHILS